MGEKRLARLERSLSLKIEELNLSNSEFVEQYVTRTVAGIVDHRIEVRLPGFHKEMGEMSKLQRVPQQLLDHSETLYGKFENHKSADGALRAECNALLVRLRQLELKLEAQLSESMNVAASALNRADAHLGRDGERESEL